MSWFSPGSAARSKSWNALSSPSAMTFRFPRMSARRRSLLLVLGRSRITSRGGAIAPPTPGEAHTLHGGVLRDPLKLKDVGARSMAERGVSMRRGAMPGTRIISGTCVSTSHSSNP